MTVKVVDLRVESQRNPLGIDIRQPRFSWKIQAGRRCVRQTAYRVIVLADAPRNTDGQVSIIWDSGRIETDRSAHIAYEGPPLRSRHRYVWKVMVWDERGRATDWSEPAYWEMALLHRSDWVAKWIEPEQKLVVRDEDIGLIEALKFEGQTDTSKLHPCPFLRRTFYAKGPVRKARLYATAHGVYVLELNGSRVGDRELAPEFTSYDKMLQYQTYDVTEQISPGLNAIGAILGDGWYAGRIGLVGTSCQYGDRLQLLLQLELEYEDGSHDRIVSDESFMSSTGHIVYSDLFIGEKVDARLLKTGWSTPTFDDSDWQSVKVVEHDDDRLVAQYGEPVRIVRRLPAKAVIRTPDNQTVIDFGQVIAGRVRMTVCGEAGTEITLEHSEVLDEKGNFSHNIMGRHKDQKDIYILNGRGEEQFEPIFSYHGFRYVRVIGYPGEVRPEAFTALVLCSDLEITGRFHCSDARLNRLQDNIVWSQTGNLITIPTDCPQRERAGWTGDIQVFAPTATFNMDMLAFLTRWLCNLRLEQADNGEVPNIVPYLDSNRKVDIALGRRISSAGWGDAVTIVPWALYQAYSDKRLLAECYEAMVKWVSYIERCASEEMPATIDATDDEQLRRQKYLWNTGFHFGDWLMPSLTGSESGHANPIIGALATKELVASCFYARSTQLLAAVSQELGDDEAARRYAELNAKIRRAFWQEYLDGEGRLTAHYQGVYVLALKFGMVPDSMREKVFAQLVQLIEDNNCKLDTGFVSVPYLLDVLADHGRLDLAYRILFQTEAPSWLYAVEKGATTIWEAWDAIRPDGTVTRMSYNHYAFGCVGDWMYRNIGGIRSAEAGYRKVTIKPGLESGLSYAIAEYESIYGRIRSEWRIKNDGYSLSFTIPPNCTAKVLLPEATVDSVQESGIALAYSPGIPGICTVTEQDGAVQVEVGSGSYHFEVRTHRTVAG